MNKLIMKSLNLLNRLRYPDALREYRACITANQYSRLHEVKFLVADYMLKKKYKVITYHGEFQQELTFTLPFAYWHYQNGTLKKTISSRNTRELYFFSPHHEEQFDKREWKGWNHSYDIPNMAHCFRMDANKWTQVPLKAHYQNDMYQFDKPLLVIANKYNIEWNKPPINFLDIPTLHRLFEKYKNKYQIVYNRPQLPRIVPDHSEILDLHEFEWIKSTHPEVLIMNELYDNRLPSVNNYNHLQLLVYANCEHFISVHGGTAALASYFGGTNIILSKTGFEHFFKEYETIFPVLSDAKILHALNEEDVLNFASNHF